MARVHYYVHGRGRGHATRTLPVLEALRSAGHEVRVFAGDDAVAVLRSDRSCTPVASLLPSQRLGLAPRLAARVARAVAELRRDRADLVVSDGDLPGIVAAGLCGRPALAVGHAEMFSGCSRPAGVPHGPWLREAARAWASAPTASARVAVSFVALEPRTPRTVVARPVGPALPATAGDRRIVCYFRDENGAGVLRRLVEQGQAPVLHSRRGCAVAGVEARPLGREEFLASLASARGVVASAGSQLISECVHHRIPIFALHDRRDDEQRVNVALLRSTGLGDGCAFSELEPARLRAFVAGLDAPRPPARIAAPELDVAAAVCRLSRELLGGAP